MDGLQVIVVHNLHQIRSAAFAHTALLVVIVVDFLVEFFPSAGDAGRVGRMVGVAAHGRALDHQRLDALIAKDGADAAPPSLLEARGLSLAVIEAKVEAAPQRMLRPSSSRDSGHVVAILLLLCHLFDQPLAHQVGVHRHIVRFLNGDTPARTVNHDDDVLLRLPLDLDGVPPGEL